jgi:hypothetical protein
MVPDRLSAPKFELVTAVAPEVVQLSVLELPATRYCGEAVSVKVGAGGGGFTVTVAVAVAVPLTPCTVIV